MALEFGVDLFFLTWVHLKGSVGGKGKHVQHQPIFLLQCLEPKKDQRKAELHTTVLSPADRLGAEQILHELIEIR